MAKKDDEAKLEKDKAQVDDDEAKLKADEAQRQEAEANKAKASELREDGPTIAEFCAAGYSAHGYPPAGFKSRSSDDEILAAIEAQEKGEPVAGVDEVRRAPDGGVIAEASGIEEAPPHGTRAAADHQLAQMPLLPGGKVGERIIDRPMTTGASG